MFVYKGGYRQDSINARKNEGQGKISSERLILLSILNSTKDDETGIATIGLKCEGEQQLIFCIHIFHSLPWWINIYHKFTGLHQVMAILRRQENRRAMGYRNVIFIECMCVLVIPSCLTVCNPMDCSPPGSSVCGILEVRILEWVVISFSKGSSQPSYWTQVSCTPGRFITIWATKIHSY